MQANASFPVNKMAQVTALFWVIKIVATTLGETLGDFIAQTLNLGYVVGLSVTGACLALILVAQIRARNFHPALFWAAIVGTTTAGTEISDFLDRTLNVGYVGGSLILVTGLLVTLALWYRHEGSLEVEPLNKRSVEIFFWVAVLFSNALGTAFGDFLVDVAGLGYAGAALICAAVIGVVLILHYGRWLNGILLFWIAFIFTRPFGASFGDLLTKPVAKGGLDLGTANASLVCVVLMIGLVWASSKSVNRTRTHTLA